MIVKDASGSCDSAEQRKDRGKGCPGNRTVIVIDDSDDADHHDDRHAELKTKGKVKKSKPLGNAKCSAQTDPQKKGNSKLEVKTNTKHLILSEHIPDSESLKEAGTIVRLSRKKRDRRSSCEQEGRCEVPKQLLPKVQLEVRFLISKSGKRHRTDCQENEGDVAGKKRKRKQPKPTGSLTVPTGDGEEEVGGHNSPTPIIVSQEMMYLDKKKRRATGQDADGDLVGKGKAVSALKEEGLDRPVSQSQADYRCKGRDSDFERLDDAGSGAEGEGRTTKKKKKKKKREKDAVLITAVDTQESYPRISDKDLLQSKSKKKKGKDKIDLLDPEKDKKVKKKERVSTKLLSQQPEAFEGGKDLPADKRKLATQGAENTVKKSKDEPTGAESCDSRSDKSSRKHGKKRKRRENSGCQDCEQENTPKKAKIKKEAKEADEEIKVVAIKKGNCDEINIDKLRRRALQEEIDRESGKTKAFKQEAEADAQFGQWSTAAFESSEQKTKFLRLLGGFKKASASHQDSPGPGPTLNMALDRSKEQKLQHSLQVEFERAVDWKKHRRVGLGFQPAPQKHTHIDKYVSKSVKFGD